MNARAALTFKIASEQSEFDQIHKLNYQTFVKEIEQHEVSESEILIDKFHKENTYIVCLKASKLVGMTAVRDKRPFSLDFKLKNLDSYLPSIASICEIRLLAVKKESRNGVILRGLIQCAAEYCLSKKYNYAIISGIISQQKLYSRIGFIPFGPLVGTQKALFQPMYLTVESFEKSYKTLFENSGDVFTNERTLLFPAGSGINL